MSYIKINFLTLYWTRADFRQRVKRLADGQDFVTRLTANNPRQTKHDYILKNRSCYGALF